MWNYVDTDDPKITQYRTWFDTRDYSPMFSDPTKVDVHMFGGEPQSVSKSWNVITHKALSFDPHIDVVIMGNDDLVYRTEGWDEILAEQIATVDQKIYCMWFNDLINEGRHCAFPIVPRLWVETLGQFTPEIFHFGYNDTWIFDIALRLGCTHYIPDVIAEHLHFSVGKSEMDDTYHRNRTQERGNLYAKDKVIYEATESLREVSAEKLKAIM